MERIVSARERVDETIPVGPGGTFFVQLDRGAVDIESHDGDEIRLIASASGVQSERADFSVTRASGDIHVDMLLDGWMAGFLVPPKVRLEAKVPRDWAVDVKTRSGRVELRDVGGDCAVETSGSRIEVSDVDGDVTLQTSGGQITLEDVSGDVRAKTSGGRIRIRRVDGDCDLQTSGGSVHAEDVLGRVDAKSSGGKIRAQFGHEASGTIKTSGGSIEVDFPQGTGVVLDARTSGGKVEIGSDIFVEGRVDQRKVEAELDGGGMLLELQTSGGSIRVDTWSPPDTPYEVS